MTRKDKAKELVDKFYQEAPSDEIEFYSNDVMAKQCALIAVDYIITSNPHSNPFNTETYSTMSYWQEVKTEIQKL